MRELAERLDNIQSDYIGHFCSHMHLCCVPGGVPKKSLIIKLNFFLKLLNNFFFLFNSVGFFIWVECWCGVAVFSAGTPILKIFFLFNFVLFFYMSGKLIFSAGTPILKIFLMSCTCFSCSYHSSQAHNSYSIYPTWTHSSILKNWKSRSLFPFPTLLKCQNVPTFSYIEWKAFPCAITLCKCSFNICHVK